MIGRLLDLLYGAVPADFESSFGLEDSVRRLSAATQRSIIRDSTHQAAVGRVSRNRVSLRRVNPFIGNSFKPFFIGEFREANGRVVLSGRFTVAFAVKAFMTFWFGFCLLWTGIATRPLLAGDPNTWWLPCVGAGMFAFGVAVAAFCKRLGRADIPWLSKVIQNALSGKPPNNRFQSDAPRAARA